MKITMVCDECGSTDVRIDAWASWSDDLQDWELAEMYENPFCMDCQGPCRIKEEKLKEPLKRTDHEKHDPNPEN